MNETYKNSQNEKTSLKRKAAVTGAAVVAAVGGGLGLLKAAEHKGAETPTVEFTEAPRETQSTELTYTPQATSETTVQPSVVAQAATKSAPERTMSAPTSSTSKLTSTTVALTAPERARSVEIRTLEQAQAEADLLEADLNAGKHVELTRTKGPINQKHNKNEVIESAVILGDNHALADKLSPNGDGTYTVGEGVFFVVQEQSEPGKPVELSAINGHGWELTSMSEPEHLPYISTEAYVVNQDNHNLLVEQSSGAPIAYYHERGEG